MVDAGPEPTYEEKMRVPPPLLGLSHDNHLIMQIRGRLRRYRSATGLNRTNFLSNRGGIVSMVHGVS